MQMFHSVPSSALPNRRSSIPLAALSLLFGLSLFSSAQGATITVESNNDSINPINGCTLRGAIDSINSGGIRPNGCTATTNAFGINDTILFAPAIAGATIVFGSQIDIQKNITIDGGSTITLDGNNIVRPIYMANGTAATIANLTFVKGNAGTNDGGAIKAFPGNYVLTVRNSTFGNNKANYGGAISVNSGKLIIEKSTFSNNSASAAGGATFAIDMTVGGSTFNSNSAPGGQGGAIRADRTASVSNSTFIGNSARQYGGAIYLHYVGQNLTATHLTFINNTASTGATIHTPSGKIDNSLIVGNAYTTTAQCALNAAGKGSLSGSANIEWRASAGNETSCKSSTPVLVPTGMTLTQIVSNTLADNGGPTQTLALPEGSPAIDTGDPAYVIATDQRGFARPAGNGPDLGAFEAEPPPVVPTGMTASVIVSKNDLLSTIRGFFEPDPQHLGQPGAAFVFILMPDLYWFLSSSSMGMRGVPGDCLSTTAFYVGPLQTMAEMPIFTDKNLSRFLGGKLYIGYGLGSHALSSTTPSPACLDMFANQRYVEVYTIE